MKKFILFNNVNFQIFVCKPGETLQLANKRYSMFDDKINYQYLTIHSILIEYENENVVASSPISDYVEFEDLTLFNTNVYIMDMSSDGIVKINLDAKKTEMLKTVLNRPYKLVQILNFRNKKNILDNLQYEKLEFESVEDALLYLEIK